MKTIEIIVVSILALVLLEKLIAKSSRRKKILHIGLIIGLIIHATLDGIRWQMTPVYLLSIILITLFFFKVRITRTWIKVLSGTLSLLLLTIGILLSHMIPVFELPKITGSYFVGTKNQTLKATANELGIINVKYWYPINKIGHKQDQYSKKPMKDLNGLMGMPGIVFSHLRLVKTGAYEVRTDMASEKKFPLVIYAHGTASANIDNTALLQEIASHGYIAVAIDFGFSFDRYGLSLEQASTLTSDAQKEFIAQLLDKVVPIQVDYISFTVEYLKKEQSKITQNIDFSKVILLGHSLGGTTCSSLRSDKFKPSAIINIDGPLTYNSISEINVPFLYISSYSPDLSDEELIAKGLPDATLYRDVKNYELETISRFFKNQSTNKHWVRFMNAGHIDFTDIPYIIPQMTTKGYDKETGHKLKSKVILNFINHYLNLEGTFKKQKDKNLDWLN